jgi:hypothetical protein
MIAAIATAAGGTTTAPATEPALDRGCLSGSVLVSRLRLGPTAACSEHLPTRRLRIAPKAESKQGSQGLCTTKTDLREAPKAGSEPDGIALSCQCPRTRNGPNGRASRLGSLARAGRARLLRPPRLTLLGLPWQCQPAACLLECHCGSLYPQHSCAVLRMQRLHYHHRRSNK